MSEPRWIEDLERQGFIAGSGSWSSSVGGRVRRLRSELEWGADPRFAIRWWVDQGPSSPLTFWHRPSARRGAQPSLTGDLAFDGELRVAGSLSGIRLWLRPARRAMLRALQAYADVIRVHPSRVFVVSRQPAVLPRLETLGRSGWGPGELHESDPRVRALWSLERIRMLADGDGPEQVVSIMENPELPDWVRLEAALQLHAEGRVGRRLRSRAALWIREFTEQCRGMVSLVEGSFHSGHLGLTESDDLEKSSDNPV
ncbi:MAG: hypothetical protein ACFB9M_11020 [Myxococcota bacterium]